MAMDVYYGNWSRCPVMERFMNSVVQAEQREMSGERELCWAEGSPYRFHCEDLCSSKSRGKHVEWRGRGEVEHRRGMDIHSSHPTTDQAQALKLFNSLYNK